MSRVSVESYALAEGRFFDLANHFFGGNRANAIGALVLFWHDSQQRDFSEGTREEICKFIPYDKNAMFDAFLLFEYIKRTKKNLYRISGNLKHIEKLAKLRESGRKGGKEKHKNKDISSTLQANARTSQAHASYYTKQNNTKQNNTKHFIFDFELAYKDYPNKIGKTNGFKKLEKQVKTEQDYQDLIIAIKKYSNYVKSRNTEKEYIKHFDTFCTNWKDWVNYTETEKTKVPVDLGGE